MGKRRLLLAALASIALGGAIGAYLLLMSAQREIPTAPLVLDLDGDGVELKGRSHAYFDMDHDGYAERSGWVAADDGFLVFDRDNDSAVDDITELLGNGGDWEIDDLHRDLAAG